MSLPQGPHPREPCDLGGQSVRLPAFGRESLEVPSHAYWRTNGGGCEVAAVFTADLAWKVVGIALQLFGAFVAWSFARHSAAIAQFDFASAPKYSTRERVKRAGFSGELRT